MNDYGYDVINGIKVSPLVIKTEEIILSEHQGSVIVESGASLLISGVLKGSLVLQNGANANC